MTQQITRRAKTAQKELRLTIVDQWRQAVTGGLEERAEFLSSIMPQSVLSNPQAASVERARERMSYVLLPQRIVDGWRQAVTGSLEDRAEFLRQFMPPNARYAAR